MGLFNNFPYTNFHELNLDWLIKKVKELEASFPQGLIGIPKGGTGANNAQDAKRNLEIYATDVYMDSGELETISHAINQLGLALIQIGNDFDANIKYKIYRSVASIGLTPGAVSLGTLWQNMSVNEIMIAPPSEFAASVCPESSGSLICIRNGGTSGSVRFYGNHSYEMEFSGNYPTGTWKQIYTDGDIVPITNGGTGADNAADALTNLGINFSGEVLSVAGVGADPTGNVPLQGSDIDINFKSYKSIIDLGLPSGSSVTAIWNAMPTYSIVDCPSTECSNPPTGATGVIHIVKLSATGYVEFKDKDGTSGNAVMFLNSSNVPTGTWISGDGLPPVVTRTLTVASSQSIAANSSTTFEATLPAVTGYSPIAIVNLYAPNADAVVRWARIVTADGKAQVAVYNKKSSAISTSVYSSIIYTKD